MAKKTIDASTIRRISAQLDCDPLTVKKVFNKGEPSKFPISKKIYEVLVSEGYLESARKIGNE